MTLTDIPYNIRIAKKLNRLFPEYPVWKLAVLIRGNLRLMDMLYVMLKKDDIAGLRFEVTRLIKQHNEQNTTPHEAAQ